MPHRLPRAAQLALTGLKFAVAGTVMALGMVPPAPPGTGDRGYVAQAVGDRTAQVSRLLDAHSCSTTGFGTERQPRSAVVRSASGRLRFVDFDTGWRVYTARGAATLVAVCLDEPPARSVVLQVRPDR